MKAGVDVELWIVAKQVLGGPVECHFHPIDAEAEIRYFGGKSAVLALCRDVEIEASLPVNPFPSDPRIRHLYPHGKWRQTSGTFVVVAVARGVYGQERIGAEFRQKGKILPEILGDLADGSLVDSCLRL